MCSSPIRLLRLSAVSVLAAGMIVAGSLPARAGYYPAGLGPGNVPWPGGVVPYEFDPALTAAQRRTYLDGLREFELAANVKFVPRTSEGQWVLFKYHPNGPNLVSGASPQAVEINLLTRGQICHEMGHSFGLAHEHQRPDRDAFIEVLGANIEPAGAAEFAILPGGTSVGGYDFESVMHYGRDVYSVQPGVLDTLRPRPGFGKYQVRLGNHALSPGDRATMRQLYGAPAVPLSPVVTHTGDGGPGSLRAAIYHATDHPGTTITFNIPPTDPGFANDVFTIKLTGSLPPLVTGGTVIDGTSQPGHAGKPLVFLDGSEILPEAGAVAGLVFHESGATVRGLGFVRFPWVGIAMVHPDAANNTVAGCWCGLDPTGTAAAPNATQGILLAAGAHHNTIGGPAPGDGNVLSGNPEYGVWISDAGTTGNRLSGNRIGTSHGGSAAVPNGSGGVIVTGGAAGNLIGGLEPGAGNQLSGNANAGLWITGPGTDGNEVAGNLIGLDAAGATALPNGFAGIYLLDGARSNVVDRNVIAGNANEGIRLAGAGTTGNRLQRNRIGLNAAGTAAVPHGFAGLTVFAGASGNVLGGGAGLGNVVSGNGNYGIVVGDAATTGNEIRGNIVGLDPAGEVAIGNAFAGVALWGGTHGNTVGGGAPGEANLIAGNGSHGIILFDAGTGPNRLRRNAVFGNGFANLFLSPGTNGDQAAPVLTSATLTTSTQLAGTLTGPPGAAFTVEFFASPAGLPAAARWFLGAAEVVIGGGGVAVIDAVLAARPVAGSHLTATATSAAGATSALSNAVVLTASDLDGDGLPDEFENGTPGLAAGDAEDAGLDHDHDGFSTLAEFRLGTDPRDLASRLALRAVAAVGGTALTVDAAPGSVYQLERAVHPAGPWLPAAVNLSGGVAAPGIVVPAEVGVPRGFFRVAGGW